MPSRRLLQANRKYTAFAALADKDGCPQAARLFRAAAEAARDDRALGTLITRVLAELTCRGAPT